MQLTTNTAPFIEANIQEQFILRNLEDGLLGTGFYRDVTGFGHGSTLEIKTIGEVTLQEVTEDTEVTYNPIETGKITFTLSEEEGDAWYITDNLKEDGHDIDALMAARAAQSTRQYQEVFEAKFLAVGPNAHTSSDPYAINGFAHKVVSAETNDVFTLTHLSNAKLAFDKANVPSAGRIFIVDPVVATTLEQLVTITSEVTPFATSLIESGMASEMKFMMNIYGWNVVTSNRLFVGTANDGSTSITGAVWNVGMCVIDDQTKPIMGSIRRLPTVEGTRNQAKRRNEFTSSTRYGFGVQRMDTLYILATHPTNVS